jgi:hypothetical protein
MATAIPAPIGCATDASGLFAFSHQPANISQAAGMTRNHRPWFETKVVTMSDQVTGGEATEPELTRMCEAMVAKASMMNWAKAMAIFMARPDPDARRGGGQPRDRLDKRRGLA